MSTGGTLVAAAAAVVTAVGVVFGPDMVSPGQIVVECSDVVVTYGEQNTVLVNLTNCRAGNVPVAVLVPESAPP